MTTTLPSFVELMASLGLESSQDGLDEHSPNNHHSRSSSYSSTSSFTSGSPPQSQAESSMEISPCIIVSSDPARDIELDKRRYRARFSPYSPAVSHIRRVSLPNVVKEEHQDNRALSSSPRSGSPLQRSAARRSSTLSLSSGRRPEKLTLDSDCVANTPISTFLRRKTPQSSPISPTFPHRRKRSSSPSLPVSIPTLPTFCFPPQPILISGSVSSDTDDDIMSDTSSTHLDANYQRRKPRYRRSTSPILQGINRPFRRPRSGDSHYSRHRLAPLE